MAKLTIKCPTGKLTQEISLKRYSNKVYCNIEPRNNVRKERNMIIIKERYFVPYRTI